MAKKTMNQMRSCEAEPEALIARPSDTLPFSVYTVALTACTAQQDLISLSIHIPANTHARANNALCQHPQGPYLQLYYQLSCMSKYAGV